MSSFTLPPNPFSEGTGAYRVYECLRENWQITTHEIHNVVKTDTARLRSDIRPFLKANGFDYIRKPLPGDGSDWLYTVVIRQAFLKGENHEATIS